LRGAEKEGVSGLFKGIAKGIGGVILKPGAAIWGLPGYTFMGIHKEVRKVRIFLANPNIAGLENVSQFVRHY
jgi:hypothetical protein